MCAYVTKVSIKRVSNTHKIDSAVPQTTTKINNINNTILFTFPVPSQYTKTQKNLREKRVLWFIHKIILLPTTERERMMPTHTGKHLLEPKHMICVLFCFFSVCFLYSIHNDTHTHTLYNIGLYINNINVAETGFLYRFNFIFHLPQQHTHTQTQLYYEHTQKNWRMYL